MAKRRTPTLSLDAFLEAIEDASGYEDDVLRHLELKPKALHAFLTKHPDARRAALELLEERGVDTTGYRLGWLRGGDELVAPPTDEDANWARLRALLQEEVSLAGQDVLEASKARTQALLERLRAQKAQAKTPKKPVREQSDWEEP